MTPKSSVALLVFIGALHRKRIEVPMFLQRFLSPSRKAAFHAAFTHSLLDAQIAAIVPQLSVRDISRFCFSRWEENFVTIALSFPLKRLADSVDRSLFS